MADKKISELSFVSSVSDDQEFPVNDAGTTKKATASQVATYIAAENVFTHSTSEQVWPFEKWVSGETIYVRTWSLGDLSSESVALTGLTTSVASKVVRGAFIYADDTVDAVWNEINASLTEVAGDYMVYAPGICISSHCTVWYTKA